MSSDESEPEFHSDYTIKNDLLPIKSKERYIAVYENFLMWRKCRNTHSLSEEVLLEYFEEMSTKYKPSTLWAMYSMVKCGLKCNHDINMEQYLRVSAFLKRISLGYVRKKVKALSFEHVEQFIDEAPDERYLATKVALIFGVTGGLGRKELCELTMNDIENLGEVFLVKIPRGHTKNKLRDSFVIQGKYYSIVEKYQSLRTSKAPSNRFFQQFRDGKCRAQVIGINKFGNMPKEIAQFLKLPDAKSYTGHSFRSISRVPESKACDRTAGWAEDRIDSKSSRLQPKPPPAQEHTRDFPDSKSSRLQPKPPSVQEHRREKRGNQRQPATEQCRFCGVFKECAPVAQKPYHMGNKVSLALNHLRVDLDFTIESLPKTVCRDCDTKLLETFEFIKQVNTAQFSLVSVSPHDNASSANNQAHTYTTNDVEINIFKAEFESDEEYNDETNDIDNSTLGETIYLKENHKRKNEDNTTKTQKKKKVKDKGTKKIDVDIHSEEFIMDIKEEIVELDDSNGEESSVELDDLETDVKPCESELSESDCDYQIGNKTVSGGKRKGRASSDVQSDND